MTVASLKATHAPGEGVPRPRPAAATAGFTLLELLVVLAILGLLAAFAVPQVMNYLGGARSDAAKIQVSNLSTALDLYRLDAGRYPSTDEGLDGLVTRPSGADRWNGPYVKRQESLIDPWGEPYLYRSPGQHGAYDLFSLGADKAEGGEGEDRDLTSW
jgi:general secretion pathway protein G